MAAIDPAPWQKFSSRCWSWLRHSSPAPPTLRRRRSVSPYSDEQEKIEDDLNQVAGTRDVSRITLHAGKLAIPDLFDANTYAHDPRGDFMNWSVWEDGAYDYAADQRGYSASRPS
jgi:hypothetical protein